MICPRCKKESRLPAQRCGYCGYSFLETRAFEQGADTAESTIGRVINDKYRIVSVLGEGGFGVVYKVELLLFDTANTFALKLLHPALSQDPLFRRRFLREAAVAMHFIHENTIQIREFGRTEDGSLFYTMDYCEGESLKAVIGREGFLTVNRALNITQQILSVMKLAHSRGIMHRDLKPENVFIVRQDGRRDFVKVGDFGLAKFIDGSPDGNITHGGILGTPRYMSPEQARGVDDLDHRSDLYSIGVVLYEMLYGEVHDERLLERSGVASGLDTPPHPGHVVPHAVWQIVRRALSHRRADRFQSAMEFSDAISALPSYTPSYVEPAVGEKREPSRWWRRTAAVLAAGLAVAIPISLTGNLGAGRNGSAEPSSGAHTASAESFLAEPEAEESDPPAPEPSPPADVAAWMPLQGGTAFLYEVFDGQGPINVQLTFEVVEEASPGVFDVLVLPEGRRIRWEIDTEANALLERFVLPDPQTGELTRWERRELLRLPGKEELTTDVVGEGKRVHAELVDLKGRHEDCLLVESREGDQSRLSYYKEGIGLVGLEVYEAEEGEGVDFRADRTPGRLVYARYLAQRTEPP